MKKQFLLFAAAVIATVGVAAQNQVDKQGRRQGHWLRTDKNGVKIYEGTFKDGLETGTFTYYYADGTVRIRNTYTEPGKVCSHEAYDEKGRLMARGTYNQRNRDGKWTFYAGDGRVVKESAYRMGVKEGVHVVFEQNGDTAEVTTWRDNRRNGRWWRRVGTRGYITATYVDGGIEGRLVEYGDDGKLAREGYYQGGLKHGHNKLYEGDRLVVDENWTHGILVDRQVSLLAPSEVFVSVFDITCLAPKGKSKVMVYFKDGTSKECREGSEAVYDRLGNDHFAYANRKGRVLVAASAIQGVSQDDEGRDVLLLDPQPDFTVYLDEDGLKMARSHQYEQDSPLDKVR